MFEAALPSLISAGTSLLGGLFGKKSSSKARDLAMWYEMDLRRRYGDQLTKSYGALADKMAARGEALPRYNFDVMGGRGESGLGSIEFDPTTGTYKQTLDPRYQALQDQLTGNAGMFLGLAGRDPMVAANDLYANRWSAGRGAVEDQLHSNLAMMASRGLGGLNTYETGPNGESIPISTGEALSRLFANKQAEYWSNAYDDAAFKLPSIYTGLGNESLAGAVGLNDALMRYSEPTLRSMMLGNEANWKNIGLNMGQDEMGREYTDRSDYLRYKAEQAPFEAMLPSIDSAYDYYGSKAASSASGASQTAGALGNIFSSLFSKGFGGLFGNAFTSGGGFDGSNYRDS